MVGPVPYWLAGYTLRAYHASQAWVQSMVHTSKLCPTDMCQWGMGLLLYPNDICQWGMGQQAHAPLTRVIWNTSQSGTLHRACESQGTCPFLTHPPKHIMTWYTEGTMHPGVQHVSTHLCMDWCVQNESEMRRDRNNFHCSTRALVGCGTMAT